MKSPWACKQPFRGCSQTNMIIQGGGWWKKQKLKWPVSLSEWCTFGVVQGAPPPKSEKVSYLCPRGGAKVRYLFGFFCRFSAENGYGTVHIFEHL